MYRSCFRRKTRPTELDFLFDSLSTWGVLMASSNSESLLLSREVTVLLLVIMVGEQLLSLVGVQSCRRVQLAQ